MKNRLLKREFRELIAERSKLTPVEVKKIFNIIVDIIAENVNKWSKVISEIGTFKKNKWISPKNKSSSFYIWLTNSKLLKRKLK